MQKEMLLEVYQTTKKLSGIDPSKPGSFKQILVNDSAFDAYVEGLAESIEDSKDRNSFKILAENTRINLLESSMYNINPFETLTLPILRVFYPKLVAKEAITVSPMDKPECIKAFLKADFTPSGSTTPYPAPVLSPDISVGPTVGVPVAAVLSVPAETENILPGSLTSQDTHLERDFLISQASADGTTYVSCNIVPAVEGNFSGSVTIGTATDVISGFVDYLTGTVSVSSATGVVTSIKFSVTCSLEENRVNPYVVFSVDKVRLYARDRQITANWSINMEQDMRALFDLSMQAEVVNIIGQQVALDLDREIINALDVSNTRLNPASHRGSFSRTPPSTYNWGEKYWHENILPVLNELSAQIYTDTNIEAGNVILCNPLDAAILEDLNGFNYTGTSSVDGDLGYRSAVVAGGKWKILTSAVVNQGKMIMVYKPQEELKCIYLYCPYVPAVLHPYPLGYTPSLTILSRYATALVRQAGIATCTITG